MTPTSKPANEAKDVLRRLGIDDPDGLWAAGWELSEPIPDDDAGSQPFLDAAGLDEACSMLNMADDAAGALRAALSLTDEYPALRRLGRHGRFLLYDPPESLCGAAARLPVLPGHFGERGRLFHALIVLAGFEQLRRRYRLRGVPEGILIETLRDVEVWMRTERRLTGTWSFTKMGWLQNHCRMRLFGLGRLQFEMNRMHLPFVAFRNASTGRVLAMPRAGEKFGPEGLFADADGADPGREGVWTSRLEIGPERIVGHPVSPARGAASRRTLEIPAPEWRQVLEPGDPAIGVHMPESGPMTHEACGESMLRAAAFFPKHFPDHAFRAFVCRSWLLDPQLGDHLRPESNIARFQREMYLVPVTGANDRQTFERVFDGPAPDPAAAPRDTSLRRAVLDHVAAGGRWRDGGCLFFAEDLAWGGEVYRRAAARDATAP